MTNNYKERLKSDREWYRNHKDKLTKRLGFMKSNIQGFNSILKLIENYNKEIVKIDRTLKDGRAW